MRNNQRSLFDNLQTSSEKREQKRRLTHGGIKSKGKRKLRRPLATKKWTHLILKSHVAKGKLSMLAPRNAKWIDALIRKKAKDFGVTLKDFINMGNHIHLEVRILNRECFQNFLRSITTMIARRVTGARKGKAFGRFWEALAYTKILTSFLEITQLGKYFAANRVELSDAYAARERYLAKENEWIQSLRSKSKRPTLQT